MPYQTIPIQLPEDLYQRLQQVAHATHHSLEEVVLQTIRGNLPPSLDDLSPELRGVVADLQHMSDETLWSVAKESLPPHQWRRHQRLLRKGQEGILSAAEHQQLAELRAEVDRFVTRRSYALALLKWHGHTISTEQDEAIDARP